MSQMITDKIRRHVFVFAFYLSIIEAMFLLGYLWVKYALGRETFSLGFILAIGAIGAIAVYPILVFTNKTK